MMDFIKELHLINEVQNVPEWVEGFRMFDDEQQLQIIEKNNQIISRANSEIADAMSVINKNKEYKSILYTNGDELVRVVFEILEEMLGCDLSDFEDEKKEDFLFTRGEDTFIGEIKGVNHNVKNENVSQLDVHYQSYLEEHQDLDENKVYALLIINHQKNKVLCEREPVHQKQIDLAIRNGSLIVETIEFLRLFEMYKLEKITKEDCINKLKSKTGLLKI